MVLLGGFSAENNKVRASTSSCSLGDVIAMSLVYYSRDIRVKSLVLFLLSSNFLVRLRPWASALKIKGLKS